MSEALRVRDIANFVLTCCNTTDDPTEVLNRSDLAEFDQIPVREGTRIIGVVERNSKSPEILHRLDDSILVSADEHLGTFIFKLKHRPYRLVIDGTQIRGIVTWSDLLKTPVLMFAYSLLAELELLMNAAIAAAYGDGDGWLEILDDGEQKYINGRKRRLERQNLLLPTIELADFSHKAKVIRTPWLDRFDFESDLSRLVMLRNTVAHVKKVVRSDADLREFVKQLQITLNWTKALSRGKSGPRRT